MKKIYSAVLCGKKGIVLFLIALFSGVNLTAQIDISIGTGTTGNTSTSFPCPLQDRWEGSRMQYLYRASELIAAGMGPGTISSIKYNVLNLNATEVIDAFQVKMRGTTTASLSADSWEPGAVSVFGPVNYQPVTGINTLALTTPFVWNGVDNILIEICNGGTNTTTGTFFTFNPTIPWTTGLSFNASHTYIADNLDNLCGTTTTTNTGTLTTRPNIIFLWTPAGPCTTPPVPGTASASPDITCAGSPINLSIAGFSMGTGQTYQWETATSATGPFTPLSGSLTTPFYTTNVPAGVSYYRCAVTCSGNTQYSDTISATGRTGLAVGTYTINSAVATGGTNFQSFADVVTAIRCGITGPVVFNVAPGSGPYIEQVIIDQVQGASAINTITFNGNGATLSFASENTNERATLKLNGADHITFDSLVINATGGTYGFGVHLINNADSNTFRKCVINSDANSTSTNYAGVVISASATSATTSGAGSLSDANLFDGNSITGGYYGMTMVGGSGATIANNKFINNTVKEFYTYGIYVSYTDNALVEKNNIIRPTRTSLSTFYGIYFTTGSLNGMISKNRISNPFGSNNSSISTFYGIYFTGCDAPAAASANKVINNLIYKTTGSGDAYGFYNTSSDHVHYYHNTISLDGTAPATVATDLVRGFYQTTTATGIIFRNNIISISRAGVAVKNCLYFATTGSGIVCDDNDLYISSTAGLNLTGTYGTTEYATLVNWQGGTTFDDNSLAIEPQFLDANSGLFAPNNPALDNQGAPLGITTDIVDASRSATTPDMGAYEYAPVTCTDPPTPGTVISDQNPVCIGTTFTLGINGGTIGAGLTYQWQSSPDNSNWTNISGATMSTLTTTQSQTTYYRVVYTCGTSVPSASIQIITPAGLSGTYTIDKTVPTGGTNYASFTDAYNAMKCGISGPVIMNVVPGGTAYNEQLTMAAIPGASAVNTITFNGNGNTITWLSSNTNERATIKLDGTDFVTFDNLIINATGSGTSEYGWGIQLTNSADSNTIKNCQVNINTTATSTSFAGIVVNNSATGATTGSAQSDGNIFDGNTITGGYYSMTIAGSSTLFNSYNKVTRNTFRDFYFYGLYVNGSFQLLVDSNLITRPTRATVSEFNGIYFTGLSASARVSRNTITNPFGGNNASTSEFNGIYFTASDPLTQTANIVSNNLVYNITGNGNVTALYNSSSDNVWYFHNTIVLDGAAASTTATNFTRGFYQTTLAAGIRVRNNIITLSRGGLSTKHIMYFNTPASDIESDNNDFFISSATGANYIGFINTNDQPILANWQAATGKDANSVSNDPLYVNPAGGNFAPSNVSVNDIGAPVNILIDITGAPRSATTPDPGAYEFAPPACVTPPTPGAANVSGNPVCENSLVLLSVSGHSTGLGQTYVWQAATNIAGPYANISSTLTNPSFTVTATATSYYRVMVTCNGNTDYSTPVLLNVTPGLPGGIYTIDATDAPSPTNFVSFNAARDAMACGITGPVVFNVVPSTGPYLEQVIFDSIPGASKDNTVTFNGNGNIIRFSSSNTNERAVIKLHSTDHFTFDSLIVDATGTGTYGFGIQLMNNADSNTIRKCTILANPTSTSTNYAGIVMSASATSATTTGATASDFNTFSGNTINGGYYGITLVGSAGQLIQSNRVLNNTINEFYNYGIYVNGNNRVHIEGNSIHRPARTTGATTVYGIYFTAVSTRSNINANRVHNLFGGMLTTTNDAISIYFTGVDAIAGQDNVVSNNAIYNMTGNGFIYGINNVGSSFAKYYHNSISLDNTASTSTDVTRGFYQLTEAEGIDFRNNIVTITRGGTGTKHAIYMGTATTVFQSNRNDLFVNATNAHVGYNGSNRTTLADWQTSATQDANSVSLDPQYTAPLFGNLTPQLGSIDNLGQPLGITADILGAPRSVTTPDIGAYEFAIIPCTAPPTAGSATASPSSGICLGTTILLDLAGNSTGGFQTYKWQRAASSAGPWTDITGELFAPQFNYVMNSSENWFRAIVTCAGNSQISTPVEIVLNPLLLAGDYTIDPAQAPSPTNFQSFAEVVAKLECGITGSVRFHVVPGTYTEQVRITHVPGSSPTSTVTFQAQNGDPTSVTLTYNATVAADNYVLKLDSASHIIYKNMTITATNTTNGRAIELAGTASGDSIVNCRVQVPASTSTSTNLVGIFATSLSGSNNVIRGNIVTNGSAGIYLSGVTLESNGIVVEDNTVEGAYYYSIYTANINGVKVNRNTMTRTGLLNTSAYGIYVSNCDSAYQVNNNTVNITNSGTTIYGIYLTGCQSVANLAGSVSNNKVTGTTGNTGNQYGIYLTTSTFGNVRNNAVAVNTSGATSYGTYVTGTGGMNFHNNSVLSVATSATNNIAAYFSQTSGANGAVNIRNNIFSHTGGGRAMYTANPDFIYSDYNMFYSSGATLIQWGTANNFATLKQWSDTSYWDLNSIRYEPAFTSTSDLSPNLASPDVWAIHGRGVQIPGNNADINNNPRPVTLAAGVPDLGAFEFVPTSVPVQLTAIPANPVANTSQVFMLGTDTVTRINWGASVPATITGRRYTGTIPPALAVGQQHMYFYTDFDITGSTPTGHRVQQFFMNPWLGTIPAEAFLKLGRTNASNVWQVSTSSTLDSIANTLTENNLNLLDKYTGLTDGVAIQPPPIVISPSDLSNSGTKFWVAYGHQYYFSTNNSQSMVLYLGAGPNPAIVTVKVNGTNWAKTYNIPANTTIASDFMPKAGALDARLLNEGWSDRGISIESNSPITAFAHIYSSASSGATMLMPVGSYGYEYYALTSKQNYSGDSYSWFYVVAPYDSTVVEITPSNPTVGGHPAGVPFTVTLKKGEVYQVMGQKTTTSSGYDMTGSKVKSIANSAGKCYPIAMFSGSSRTAIACDDDVPTLNGDNIIQQNFPYRAWGKRYLTAPTSASTSATTMHTNLYKVAVKDPTTEVRVNGVLQTNLINGLYYQFTTNTSAYIEANKPVMVAQFIGSTGECGGTGVYDPEMIYLSPIEQGIKKVGLYRNTEDAITVQYLTIVIPAEGLASLTVDGSSTFDHVYDHYLAGYKVVVKRWTATNGPSTVQSDYAFTGITYGLGSVESYGYNAGTLILNLNVLPSITNVFNPAGTPNAYTCAGTPFTVSFLSTVQPNTIEWNFSQVPNISPNTDVVQTNPVHIGTEVINGVTYYRYALTQQYVFSTPGSYNIPIAITHPEVEGCNNRMPSSIPVTVIGSPTADFNNLITACPGSPAAFDGSISSTVNSVPIITWNWNFGDASTGTGQTTTHTYTNAGTYDVKLDVIAAEGCIASVTKPVTVGNGPVPTFVPDSVGVCPGGNVIFTVQNPVANATYQWYTAPTGGSPVATGTSFTITNVTGPVSYYVGSILNGCPSPGRTRVQATVRPALAIPVVVVDSVGTNLIRFRWNAVPNATGYEVTTNAGANWITPSSGSTGLTHTVTGLSIGQTVTLQVRALGGCLPAVSQPVPGTTVTDQLFLPNAFTPNNDGRNDEWRIYGNVIRSVRAMVFNQWGEKIAEVVNPARAADGGYRIWDGRHKGEQQPSGVYIYVCEITLVDGTKVQRKGSINLAR